MFFAAWQPYSLFHCINSDFLTWLTIILCLGVSFGYFVIAKVTWLPAMRAASPKAKAALLWMACIFLFCGVAGYSTVALAAFFPKIGYIIRVLFLFALNIVNPLFLMSKHGKEFRLLGEAESLGAQVIDTTKGFVDITDQQLGLRMRVLMDEYTRRRLEQTLPFEAIKTGGFK